MTNTFDKKSAFRAALIGGASVLAMSAAPAFAQDDDDAASDDKVIVTGSRIANPSLTGSSPITTVGAVDLSLSNTVNSEQFLNALPQTVPGFDSSSNNPGIGEATVNLRGLGAVRTLVLVNGRRYVSSNQNAGVVDLNTIPTALVERVDILTGGASATYGSEAMAGVVNFILKDDFEGIQLDTSYEMTEENDGEIFNTSLTVGGNFDNGRGNAVLNVGYTDRQSVFQGDRAEAGVTLNDVGTGFSESGSVNIPSTLVLDPSFFGGDEFNFTQALGITPPCTQEGTTLDSSMTYCTSDSFGFLFDPDGSGALPFINGGPNNTRYNYAPANYLQIPQERYNVYASATYDITPTVEAFAQAIFVSSQTEQLLAPTPVGSLTVTVNFDNPFIAGETDVLDLLQQLQDQNIASGFSSSTDSDGNGTPDAQLFTYRRTLELGGRVSDIRNDSFQLQGGLRGTLWDSWDWNLFGSFGQAETSITQTGNVDILLYQAAVANNSANIFEPNGVDPAVAAGFGVTGAIDGVTEKTEISADISGELPQLSSPWATNPTSVAFGVEYREESLSTAGTGLGPTIVGFNQAPATSGSFTVNDVFVEANVPLIEDVDLIDELVFTGAFRRSDYSTVGDVNSYAAGLSWTPTSGLRFRGQYQRAVRAPNIGELFQPQVNGFPGVSDPCSGGANGAYDGYDASTQATVMANCIADGVPSAQVGANLQVNAQIQGLFGGNPALEEEVADTYTYGVVWEPNFVDNLAITLDYYDIEIENVITTVPSQTVFDLCYVSGISSFCNNITRGPGGQVSIFNSSLQNVAALVAKGVDMSIDYSYDTAEWGTFGIYSLITYQEENSLQSLPTESPVDCVGYYGATCGEPTPEWKYNTRFDWSMGPYGARLRWQRLGEVQDDLFQDGGTPNLFVEGVDAYDQYDLTLFYTMNDNVYWQFGIENLTDEDFVIIGDASAEQSNTYPASYDTLGRTYFGRVVLSW
ncbi:TonB-dependent receptor domain-containing protein [Parvularcula marina]|nr:TonB-dependent receptor [Parvularcula marina]